MDEHDQEAPDRVWSGEFRMRSDLHERELLRGGMPPLKTGDAWSLINDASSSKRDLLIIRLFNISAFEYEHIWVPRIQRECRKLAMDMRAYGIAGERVMKPYYKLSLGVRMQKVWTESRGPIAALMTSLPNVRKFMEEKSKLFTVQEQGRQLQFPSYTHRELENVLVVMFKKECESMLKSKALQHIGSAKLHTIVYKVGPADPRRPSPSKRGGKLLRLPHTRLAVQGRLCLIKPGQYEAWISTARQLQDKTALRIDSMLQQDGCLSVWFDDIVEEDVRKDKTKTNFSDYAPFELQLTKLREVMAWYGFDDTFKLGYRLNDDDERTIPITARQDLAAAIATQQSRMAFGMDDDYVLIMGRVLDVEEDEEDGEDGE